MRKRHLNRIIGPKTFAFWADAGRMMLDSAQVIAHRTQRMAKTSYSAADRREFARMVHEKIAAAQEAAVIVSHAMVQPARLPGAFGQAVKPFAKRARANAKRLSGKNSARKK